MKYVFICNKCKNIFEVDSHPSEISGLSPICTVCDSSDVSRKYTPIVTHFKGNGFYTTDKGKNNDG